MPNFYTNVQLVGDKIFYRGYENGESVSRKEEFSPTLFVKSNKKTEYKTLDGLYVEPIVFSGPREARDFIKKYEEVENFEIFGNERFLYQYISKEFPEDIEYDISKIKLFSLDIETTSENGFPKIEDAIEEVLCITVKDYFSKKIFVWGQNSYVNTRQDITYINCCDEETLLRKFHHWWVFNTPDIVTGWNIKFFDIPYICKRIERVLGEKYKKSLSPWNMVNEKEILINNKSAITFDILGVSTLDYLDLYKKFTYSNQESYRLDHIASVELGEAKLDHSEYETFKEFYTSNWQKFVNYNIHDTELVDRLEDKMKLIELAITMAYDAKVNYQDVYSQVKMWDTIIYNYLLKRNIVIPPTKNNEKDSQYAGAYVKEPVPGMYEWVVSYDLASLYPHIIMMFNLSPETLLDKKHPTISIEKILNKTIDLSAYSDYCVCPNGSMYRKDIHGFLPELMEKIYNDRKIYKKKMLDAEKEYENTKNPELIKDISKYNNIQMARKIQLNSAYGAIGNKFFRYYKLEIAEAITLSGQVSIRWIGNKMNYYLNNILNTEGVDYVIASDTDSIYLNLGPLVCRVFGDSKQPKEKIVEALNKLCETKIKTFIDESYQELADYINAYSQKMQMKRECIADRGIWTAKKRYILNVWDSEGVRYHEPKLKIMGIESVRSSTPAFCRNILKESFNLIMNSNNETIIKFINEQRKLFKEQKITEISFPRTVNGISKYKGVTNIYEKGTPINVRGALLYNYYLSKYNIKNKYPEILEGEKIKYIYLKTPNPFNENVIAYIQELPKEFNIDKYIDYELQFDKSFLEPLKVILDAIGWKIKNRGSLDSFFS